MGIGKISDYENLMHQYRIPSIPEADIRTAETKAAPDESVPVVSAPDQTEPVSVEKRPAAQPVRLEDVSLSLGGGEPFEMTGRDSNIELLDVDAIVSDSQKDGILDKYRFFVGSAQRIMDDNMGLDGIVLTKF